MHLKKGMVLLFSFLCLEVGNNILHLYLGLHFMSSLHSSELYAFVMLEIRPGYIFFLNFL